MRRRSADSLRSEADIIAELLEEAHALNLPAIRTWTAPWLLSPIHGTSWCLRLDGSIQIDGVWHNVLIVDWDDQLPDGTKLSDPCNRKYLEFLQKAAFLIRDEILDIRSTLTHVIHLSNLKALTQWIFTQSRRYSPAEYGFSKVDIAGIHDFLKKYIAGGLFEAGDYAARFLKRIDEESYNHWKKLRPNVSIRELPENIVQAVSKRLHEFEFYKKTLGTGPNQGLNYINRIKAAKLVAADLSTMRIPGANAFFRQFEDDYKKRFGRLLVRVTPINREYISHRTRTLDYTNSQLGLTQVTQAITTIQCLDSLSEELPFSLKPLSSPNLKSPLSRYLRQAASNDHTPWMPLETSFAYLNAALRWILEIGPVLVDFYLKAIRYFKETDLLASSKYEKERVALREQWTAKNMPAELKEAGITGWSEMGRGRRDTPRRIPVYYALTILLGACLYLITGTLPARIDEVVSLEKTCLSFTDGDGFWLHKRRGKAVEEDKHHTMNVPIPRVAATAVSLLIRLGVESRDLMSNYNTHYAKYLLYLPVFHALEVLNIGRRNEHSINYALDQFCDHVGLPPDELGRRWYARIHENRKAFLLSFVWYFKGSALDAARWLAGHTDPKYILAYIKANIPGEEISELEADYLARVLWDFGMSKRKKSDVRNISDLYRRVCTQFHVREISEVTDKDLNDYLELCLFEGKYQIEVINIVTKSGKHEIALTVRMKKGKSQISA